MAHQIEESLANRTELEEANPEFTWPQTLAVGAMQIELSLYTDVHEACLNRELQRIAKG